jgi:hypothetical protein
MILHQRKMLKAAIFLDGKKQIQQDPLLCLYINEDAFRYKQGKHNSM